MDDRGRLRLTTVGAREDIARLPVEIHDGMLIIGHDDELTVEATVRYNSEEDYWVAEFDRDAVQVESEERLNRDRPVAEKPSDAP